MIDLTEWADALPPSQPLRGLLPAMQLLADAATLRHQLDQLAVRISVDWQTRNPTWLTCVPAGLWLSGALLQRMVFPLRLATLTSMEEELKDLEGGGDHHVLVVAPTAETLEHLHARGVSPQCLHVVQLIGTPSVPGEYQVLDNVETRQLLGCGHAIHDYGANLPALYALDPHAGG